MRYWLTTQYPPRVRPDDPVFGVWLEHEKRDAILDMASGDPVFIYQMKGGRVRIDPDGPNPCVEGRQGIILHGHAAEGLTHHGDDLQRFEDGARKRWCCGARLDKATLDASGFVPLARVNRILGFSPNYQMRFIGKGGVRELRRREYDALVEEFGT